VKTVEDKEREMMGAFRVLVTKIYMLSNAGSEPGNSLKGRNNQIESL
jgi:hypothetical protein